MNNYQAEAQRLRQIEERIRREQEQQSKQATARNIEREKLALREKERMLLFEKGNQSQAEPAREEPKPTAPIESTESESQQQFFDLDTSTDAEIKPDTEKLTEWELDRDARLAAEVQAIEDKKAKDLEILAKKLEEDEYRRTKANIEDREREERLALEANVLKQETARKEAEEREREERLAAEAKVLEEQDAARIAAEEREREERLAAEAKVLEEQEAARLAAEEREREERLAAEAKVLEEQEAARLAAEEREREERLAAEAKVLEEQEAARLAAEEREREERLAAEAKVGEEATKEKSPIDAKLAKGVEDQLIKSEPTRVVRKIAVNADQAFLEDELASNPDMAIAETDSDVVNDFLNEPAFEEEPTLKEQITRDAQLASKQREKEDFKIRAWDSAIILCCCLLLGVFIFYIKNL